MRESKRKGGGEYKRGERGERAKRENTKGDCLRERKVEERAGREYTEEEEGGKDDIKGD